jgi:uncharacterized protein YcaQ
MKVLSKISTSESCVVSREVAGAALIHDLLRPWPTVLATLQSLGAVQIDPTTIVAPNHHLVLGCRVEDYAETQLEQAIESKSVLELYAHGRCLVPIEDFPLYWPLILERRRRHRKQLEAQRSVIHRIRSRIARTGPSSVHDFEAEPLERSSRWGPRRDITEIFDLLWQGGYLAVARRRGNRKYYDFLENVLPSKIVQSKRGAKEQRFLRWRRYIQAVRLTDTSDPFLGFERASAVDRKAMIQELLERGEIKRLRIEGVERQYVASSDFAVEKPTVMAMLPTLVAPLDNLVWRRTLLQDLWAFRYRWEIYTPPPKRCVGPYGMPLVTPDGILGQADVQFDRKNGTLLVRPASPVTRMSADRYFDSLEEASRKLASLLGAQAVALSNPV